MGDKLIMSKKERQRKSMLDLVKIGQLTQVEASRRLGLSYRQTKRIYRSYLMYGDEGLIHKSRGKPSSRAYTKEMKQAILSLYKQKYLDFGPTLASEKLEEEDGYKLHAETRHVKYFVSESYRENYLDCLVNNQIAWQKVCLLYTSPSPRD